MILCNIYKIGRIAEHWSKAYKIQTPWVAQFRSTIHSFPSRNRRTKCTAFDSQIIRCLELPHASMLPQLCHILYTYSQTLFASIILNLTQKKHCKSPPHLHGIILTAPIHMKKFSEAVSEQPNLGQTLQSLPITFARQATTPDIIILDKNAQI